MLRRRKMTIARIKQKLTQRELADKLGYNYNYILRLERGEVDPNWQFAIQLCKLLKIKLDDLAEVS